MNEVRLFLTIEDYEYIKELLKKRGKKSVYENFNNAIEEYEERIKSKKEATKKASEAKVKRVKEKINNAIQVLKFMNKKITIYQIAKEAGISFNTAKKYKDYINSKLDEKIE